MGQRPALLLEALKIAGDTGLLRTGQSALDVCAGLCAALGDAVAAVAETMAGLKQGPIRIRVGIHTGPVVAGVVGIKKFSYDIWGDTVNIASRMESSGEAGKVNISGSTYELVKNLTAGRQGEGARE